MGQNLVEILPSGLPRPPAYEPSSTALFFWTPAGVRFGFFLSVPSHHTPPPSLLKKNLDCAWKGGGDPSPVGVRGAVVEARLQDIDGLFPH